MMLALAPRLRYCEPVSRGEPWLSETQTGCFTHPQLFQALCFILQNLIAEALVWNALTRCPPSLKGEADVSVAGWLRPRLK
jgi:hypothetical protein